MIRIYLTEEQCKASIPEVYENISMILNGESRPTYDCRRICVGDKVENAIREHYKEQGWSDYDINMAWLMFGPKMTLEGYAVEVEDGWCDGEGN